MEGGAAKAAAAQGGRFHVTLSAAVVDLCCESQAAARRGDRRRGRGRGAASVFSLLGFGCPIPLGSLVAALQLGVPLVLPVGVLRGPRHDVCDAEDADHDVLEGLGAPGVDVGDLVLVHPLRAVGAQVLPGHGALEVRHHLRGLQGSDVLQEGRHGCLLRLKSSWAGLLRRLLLIETAAWKLSRSSFGSSAHAQVERGGHSGLAGGIWAGYCWRDVGADVAVLVSYVGVGGRHGGCCCAI